MSNSNFVITPATPNPSGIRSLDSILSPAPFFDPAGNLNMNGLDLIGNASSATTVALTSDNTSGTYFIPFSKPIISPTSNALYIDNATTPLTYNPSTSTLTATIFSTATAPVSANQLGNKTYIDNFGGSGGWYYTTNVSVSASTTINFPNCLDNTYNAYEIYFIPNFTAPTSGFVNLNMTFSGSISGATYQSYNQFQNQGSPAPTFTNTYLTTAPSLLVAYDFSSSLNRTATIKLDLWGTRNATAGAGSAFRLSYLTEGFSSQNPALSAWGKNMGTISYSSGIATGIIFTYSTAITGSMTIIVKAKY